MQSCHKNQIMQTLKIKFNITKENLRIQYKLTSHHKSFQPKTNIILRNIGKDILLNLHKKLVRPIQKAVILEVYHPKYSKMMQKRLIKHLFVLHAP